MIISIVAKFAYFSTILTALITALDKLIHAEPQKGHFLPDIYQKRTWNKEIRTEIKTKNISFNQLIISFKRYNKSLKRYKIEWKLKQEKQNGN